MGVPGCAGDDESGRGSSCAPETGSYYLWMTKDQVRKYAETAGIPNWNTASGEDLRETLHGQGKMVWTWTCCPCKRLEINLS